MSLNKLTISSDYLEKQYLNIGCNAWEELSSILTEGILPPVKLSSNINGEWLYFSDGSAQDDGWNITLQPNTPYPTSAISVAEGTTLYLDNSDYSKVSTDNTSQIVLGYCAYSDASNDSLLINVRPPRI